jgi:hypothetical protein
MRFLLITASDTSAESRANLASLMGSVADQATPADLILVTRGRSDVASPPDDTFTLHSIERPPATTLSESRNFALAYAREHGLLERAAVVGFPDDDCAYPPDLLRRVGCLITNGVDVACGPYAPSRPAIDGRRFPLGARSLTPAFVTRVLSSNNVFFTSEVVRAIGDFDQRFGLGAPLGSAEDADYALRALAAGFTGWYSPQDVFVEHPYKRHRAAQYYLGNVAVLAKHVREDGHLPFSLLHRLGVGARLVWSRELRARDYLQAVAAAVSLLGESLRNGGRTDARPRRRGA